MRVQSDRRGVLRFFGLLLITVVAWPGSAGAEKATASTPPAVICIIRHGEKPDSKEDPNLTPKGYQRADALAQTFPKNFFVPDVIWATEASKHSNRPVETITPLAKSLGEEIHKSYADSDYAKLAHELLTDPKYAGKKILICWHHGEIPALAKALGAKDAPEKWKAEEFSRVWELTFTGDEVQFQNLPEKALPDDADK
jgi:phosphohistidine phosphatase SixA